MGSVNPSGAVAVKGLRELNRAFKQFDRDLIIDMRQELEEAADPVRKTTEQYILRGGGGFPAMKGVVRNANWAEMRIGVSARKAEVYVAPAWRSNKGTLQGQILAMQYRWRMEGAIEDKSAEIEKRLGNAIDNLCDAWEKAA